MRLSAVVPSPQSMLIDETVPSGSVAENVAVTTCPVLAGLGETLDIETVGGRSLTVSDVCPDPDPPAFVAVTVIVNVCDIRLPIDA